MNALLEEGRRAERKLRALEALADVVGDLITEPGADPELRAAWIAYREAVAS